MVVFKCLAHLLPNFQILHNLQSVPDKAGAGLGMVGEQADFWNFQIPQNLGANAEIFFAQIGV